MSGAMDGQAARCLGHASPPWAAVWRRISSTAHNPQRRRAMRLAWAIWPISTGSKSLAAASVTGTLMPETALSHTSLLT